MLRKYYNHVTRKDEDKKKDADDKGGDGFPSVENAFFIFGGPTANMTPWQRKRECREAFSVHKATPSYLDWSEDTIFFSREDHPDYIPNSELYPLVVDPIIGNTRFSKVLMDGGNSLNILYTHTLELMGIGLDKLCPSVSPFHGIIPGKRVQPLGQIDLPVCFGTPANFRKEVLTFEVVGFRGAYHAILGRPYYAKFMAFPNYTYLKMKMPGPKSVITVGPSFEHAYECDVECVERAEAQAEDEALAASLDKMANKVMDSTHRHAGSFEPAEGIKKEPLDPSQPNDKALQVSATLDSK
jgi:hypothetical protein